MSAVPDLERLSALIDFIYRGATEPALWPDIVASAGRWLGSGKGMLYTPLHSAEQGGFYFQHGLSDFFFDLYKARYQAVDMWTEQVVARDLFKEGNVVLGTDLVAHATLVQSAWYRDGLRLGGISQLLSSVVFGGPSPQAEGRIADMPTACSFYRDIGDPVYSEDDRRKLALLLPHISRALGVMTRLQLSDFQVAASLSALNRLPSAVLLMTGTGQVLFANQAASALLAASDALRIEPGTAEGGLGRLVARVASVNREIAGALAAAQRIDDVAHFSSVIKVPGRVAGNDGLLQLSRVRLGSAFRAEGRMPEVIAFLTDTQRPLQVDTDLLLRTYGLTPGEARVAIAATAAGSVDDLAGALSLGSNTVKTHLKSVYAKTGVQSRAELVRVMLGLACAT
jgi:DNA-binding CsgD family transcriptional regulator